MADEYEMSCFNRGVVWSYASTPPKLTLLRARHPLNACVYPEYDNEVLAIDLSGALFYRTGSARMPGTDYHLPVDAPDSASC